jgi:hypothetical protein
MTTLTRIERQVESLDDRLDVLERQAESEQRADAVHQRVYKSLPPARPHSEAWERAMEHRGGEQAARTDPIAWEGTLEALRKEPDAPDHPNVIDAALEQLIEDDDTPPVKTSVIDGERRYWKGE